MDKLPFLVEDCFNKMRILDSRSRILDAVWYKSKDDYYSLLSDFLSKKIDFVEFHSTFFNLDTKDRKTSERMRKDLSELLSLSIKPESNDFNMLIWDIWYKLSEGFYDSCYYYEFKNLNSEEKKRAVNESFMNSLKRIQ